jgi:hypothetical protein
MNAFTASSKGASLPSRTRRVIITVTGSCAFPINDYSSDDPFEKGGAIPGPGCYLCAAADGMTYSESCVGGAPWTIVYAYSTPMPYAPQ